MRRMKLRRGNAMIEFALGAGVLTVLMLSTFRFGYSFYVYDQLQSVVRNGARYASLRPYRTTSGGNPCSENTESTKYMTVYGEPVTSAGSLPVGAFARVKDLTVSNVAVTYTLSGGVPITAEVRISNFTVNGLFGTTTLTNKPVASLPYLGAYAPFSCP